MVVEHRGRLGGMNTGLVEAALRAGGRELVVLDAGELDDDPVRDMTGVLTSFLRLSVWASLGPEPGGEALRCAGRDVGPMALSQAKGKLVS